MIGVDPHKASHTGGSLGGLPAVHCRAPSGWTAAGAEIASGRASFVLDSGQAGLQAVTITLTATCDTSGTQQIPSDQPGMRRFERPPSLVPEYSAVRYYTFPGGCATFQFAFAPGASPALASTVDSAVAFMPRSVLAGYVRRTEGLALCGRGAACPGLPGRPPPGGRRTRFLAAPGRPLSSPPG